MDFSEFRRKAPSSAVFRPRSDAPNYSIIDMLICDLVALESIGIILAIH
jgi:hypothetical protein